MGKISGSSRAVSSLLTDVRALLPSLSPLTCFRVLALHSTVPQASAELQLPSSFFRQLSTLTTFLLIAPLIRSLCTYLLCPRTCFRLTLLRMPSSVASDDSHNDVSETAPLPQLGRLTSPTGRLHRRHRGHPGARHWCCGHLEAKVQRLLHYRLRARSHSPQPAEDQGLQRGQGRQGQGRVDEMPGILPVTTPLLSIADHWSPMEVASRLRMS
jgi:hypothetical protein